MNPLLPPHPPAPRDPTQEPTLEQTTDHTLDHTRVDGIRIRAVRPLITPALLQEWFPASRAIQSQVAQSREQISRVLHGADDRLVVIVGPGAIHDRVQALDYAKRLADQRARLQEDLLLVMRVYFEKPRTTVGWKGLINDPHLDGSNSINEGLQLARQIMLEIARLGLPMGVEYLDLLSPQFISDLVSWGAIGARTTESQSHRQLASGLSCPVGFKNGTDGSIQVAADAVIAAGAPHAFLGLTKMGQAAVFETRGNSDCHIILRGGRHPNYGPQEVQGACELLRSRHLPAALMIDCSHNNSNKIAQRQIEVAAQVQQQIAGQGGAAIIGVMLESHLHEGRQEIVPGAALRYGVSVTDACISFEQTVDVLGGLATAVQQRRARAVII